MKYIVKTLVVGPEDLVERVIRQGKSHSRLQLISAPYKRMEDAKEIVRKHVDEADVILMTGPVPYMLVQSELETINTPILYIEYAGSALYRSFFQVFQENKVHMNNRISIDFLNEEGVNDALDELEIDRKYFEIFTISSSFSSEDVTRFHYDLWKKGNINIVITCLYSVYERLKELGVSTYCIIPTRSDIKSSLHIAERVGEHKLYENNQIAACWVYSHQTANVEEKMKTIAQTLQTSMQKVSNQTYLFYTTKAFIFSLTNGYKKLPDFLLSNDIIMGVGTGLTAKEAKVRAESAYLKSRNDHGRTLYIVGEDNSVVRISDDVLLQNMQYQSRAYDERLRKIAADTGLGIATLSKIQFVSKATGKSVITAAELSEQLQVTLRSARRILKALTDHGYVDVIGEEQPINRGRPRKIYRLML